MGGKRAWRIGRVGFVKAFSGGHAGEWLWGMFRIKLCPIGEGQAVIAAENGASIEASASCVQFCRAELWLGPQGSVGRRRR